MEECKVYKYDVVLSFAGEDRKYVQQVANYLINSGIKVFYDVYEDVDLWGKDLYQHLDNVYQNLAKYAVIFISEAYGKKVWTNHELKSAQARAFTENEEYILPARFDETEIPGLRKTVGYVSLDGLKPFQFAKKIIKKLGDIEPVNFLPDNIIYVVQIMQSIYENYEEDEIENDVARVFGLLKKTSDRERNFLSNIILYSCKHDIEEDLHEDITLFERITGNTRSEILDILRGLSNLGFSYKIINSIHGSKKEGNRQKDEMLHIKLSGRRVLGAVHDNLTLLLTLMYIGARRGLCESCGTNVTNRLDFTRLQKTVSEEELEFILSCIPSEK